MDLFVIDLQEWALDKKLFLLSWLNDIHDVKEGTWDDALQLLMIGNPHHRKGLAAACLAICKDSAIVTLYNWLD